MYSIFAQNEIKVPNKYKGNFLEWKRQYMITSFMYLKTVRTDSFIKFHRCPQYKSNEKVAFSQKKLPL